MSEFVIAPESPRQDDIVAMVHELDVFGEALYPPEANFHLSIDELCIPEITFLTARRGAELMGIGALWARDGVDFGEVKRMYVRDAARGLGLGNKMLAAIEALARQRGLTALMLETGDLNTQAMKLYVRSGFVRRGPFADYPDAPLSVFMEKALT
jgi:putative acetyltransferase